MTPDPVRASEGHPSHTGAEHSPATFWYACRTRARAEKQVDRLLTRAGLETYLPLVERERAWSDRTKRIAFPLFPGYTFARFSAGERFLDVVRTPGVVEVVGRRERPSPLRQEELDAVRSLVRGAEAGDNDPEPVDWWESGTPVEIIGGPFKGMRGELLEVRGSMRFAVRLSAIRMAASVEVDWASVREVA